MICSLIVTIVLSLAGSITDIESRLDISSYTKVSVNENGDKLYNCCFCAYNSLRLEKLKRHLICCHTRNTERQCQICEMWLKNMYALRTHELKRHGKKVAPPHPGNMVKGPKVKPSRMLTTGNGLKKETLNIKPKAS